MQLIEFPSDRIIKEDEDNSIYQYRKGYNLQFESPQRLYSKKEVFENIEASIATGKYSIVDIEIIKILYKFRWLNKRNIEKYLNETNILHQQMKKPKYDTNIKRLRADGVISTFSRAPVFAGEESRIIVYRLSEGAYDYASMFFKIPRTYLKEADDIQINTANALEIMSLNQWHIAMITGCSYQKSWYRVKFKRKQGNLMIDSAFRLSVDKKEYGTKTLMLYAFAMPKKENSYDVFVNHLLAINSFLNSPDNKYKASIIIVTCESTERMKKAYAALRTFSELDELDMLFALDNETIDSNGIEKLYSCEYNAETQAINYFTTSINVYSSADNVKNSTDMRIDEF